ncbi:MAG: T9SS type A sorting domain-containing protein [Bacteroidota bacterium]
MIRSFLKYTFLFAGLFVFLQVSKAQQVIIGDAANFNLAVAGTVDINANLVNNSPNASFTGTFNFIGDIPYEISGTSPIEFATLSLSSTAGISLLTDVSVNTGLILNSGTLNLVNNNLTIGSAAAITGTFSPTTMVVADGTGALKRKITGDGIYLFPIGDTSGTTIDYSLASLTFSSGTYTDAIVSINVKNEVHPENSSPADYINRYWTVSQTGITDFSCDVSFLYTNEDIQGTESNIWGAQWDGSQWTTLNQASLNQFGGTVTSFSDFTAGDKSVMSIDDKLNVDDIDIIVDQGNIIIRSDKNIKLEKAEIYSLLGQLVYSKGLNSSSSTELSFNASSDYYIVKVFTENQFISKKVFKQ